MDILAQQFIFLAVDGGGYELVMLLAIMILTGMYMGRVAEKFRIPNVTGYLALGIVFGLLLIFLGREYLVDTFMTITMFCLGFIAFSIGLELDFGKLRRRRNEVIIVTLIQATAAFLFTALGLFLFRLDLHIALVLGAIAIATEPGPILHMTKRYKTRGELTDTLVPLHGVEDAFAIVVFGLVLAYAVGVDQGVGMSFSDIIFGPVFELLFSVLIGVVIGYVFSLFIYRLDYHDADKDLVVFVTTVVAILASISLANQGFYLGGIHVHLSPILLPMVVGITFANLSSRLAKHETEHMLDLFSPPVIIAFFTIVGAEKVFLIYLESGTVPGVMLLALAFDYIISRIIGKLFGTYIGGVIGKSTKNVQKYLGFCLLPQAQAAMALALYARAQLSNPLHGNLIVLITIIGTLVYELLGPFGLRHSFIRCDEVDEHGACIIKQRKI